MAKKTADPLWEILRKEAESHIASEPELASLYHASILNHASLASAAGFHLASKLDSETVSAMLIRDVFSEAFANEPQIVQALRKDLVAHKERDPACREYCVPFLYFKGFHAVQTHRIAHFLWLNQRFYLALYLQSRMSISFGADIHPGAKLGQGVMVDHGTGLVIGETAFVGNNVSLLHSVTLGGMGHAGGDRHPKVGDGALISTGAKILGNVKIGAGAKIAAGSVVLNDVAAHTTVAGVPARVIGKTREQQPALEMDQQIPQQS